MAHLEGAYEQIDRRLGSMDDRISGLEARFLSLEQKVDRHFQWLAGLIVGTWTTTILTILFHR